MKNDGKDVDIVLLRKRRKRRRQLTKFVIILVIAMFGITAYVKMDEWFPALEGIGSNFKSVKSSGDGKKDGSFNLSVSGGIDYQMGNLNGNLAILSDAYLYIYSQSGELLEERQHTYANAMLQTAGKRTLIYESGGNNFRVDNSKEMVYSKKLDDPIIFGRISSGGRIAIITSSENYVCRLIVFDKSGKEIYSRNCVERVIDLAFNSKGDGCILSTSDALNGELITELISVSFDSKDDKWKSEPFDSLCIKTYYDENGIFLIGSNKCAYYNNDGTRELDYVYPCDLVDWDHNSNGVVLLFDDETKRQSYFTAIESGGGEKHEKLLDVSGSKCIQMKGSDVFIMNKDGITKYQFDGTDGENISSENSYDSFVIIDKYIFLLGYDRIDRMNY